MSNTDVLGGAGAYAVQMLRPTLLVLAFGVAWLAAALWEVRAIVLYWLAMSGARLG